MRKVLLFGALTATLIGFASLAPARSDDKDKQKLKTEIEVPFVPTPEKVVEAMLKLANVKEGDTVYDLGCGDGRIVITAVKEFKARRGLGLDYDPARLKDCEERIKMEKLTEEQAKKITFKQGDVLKMSPEDFKDVDVVTLYLYPSVNQRLKPVLQKGLKPGARVVSHAFSMGEDWPPEKEVAVDSSHTIYLWTIKDKK